MFNHILYEQYKFTFVVTITYITFISKYLLQTNDKGTLKYRMKVYIYFVAGSSVIIILPLLERFIKLS